MPAAAPSPSASGFMRADAQCIQRPYSYDAPAAHTCCSVCKPFAGITSVKPLQVQVIIRYRHARFDNFSYSFFYLFL